MASPAQILANRENAKLSSGPKTHEGKQASSRNATRHALTGTQIVMPGEDEAAYEKLRHGMVESYRPANEAERVLVDQIAANAWRLMRPNESRPRSSPSWRRAPKIRRRQSRSPSSKSQRMSRE
jgi:hypothetical protein